MIANIISGIRKSSDADIVILDGTPNGESILPIYQKLAYDFPRVLMLDVKDCVWVEVDNPLPKPLLVPTFWIPNVILSSDYLISVTPLKVVNGQGNLSIMNLLPLLPVKKYSEIRRVDHAESIKLSRSISHCLRLNTGQQLTHGWL
jgi:hypothetical protein